jgi:hypothetical protein
MQIVALTEKNSPAADAAPPFDKGGLGGFLFMDPPPFIEETCISSRMGWRLSPPNSLAHEHAQNRYNHTYVIIMSRIY